MPFMALFKDNTKIKQQEKRTHRDLFVCVFSGLTSSTSKVSNSVNNYKQRINNLNDI